MKVLLSANTDKFTQAQALEAQAIPVIEDVIAAYNSLELEALNANELPLLFKDPIGLIFDKMTGGNPVSIAGIQVIKSKAIDLLEKPVGYDNLLKLVKDVQNRTYAEQMEQPLLSSTYIDNRFTLNGSGEVIFKPAYLTMLEESLKTYISSDLAQKINSFADDVVTAFNARGLSGKVSNSNGIGYLIAKLFTTDERILTKDISQIVKTDSTSFHGNF